MGILRRDTSLSSVDRVARYARSHGRTNRSTRHFLVLVAAIIVFGSSLVGFAWAERQYQHPTLFDSWQNAYAVFDCQSNSWIEPFPSASSPNGIRTRGDGIIYIEPTVESATGNRATLGLFLSNVGVSLTDNSLTLPDGTRLTEDISCDNQPAVLQVMRWQSLDTTADPSEIRSQQLAETRFLDDQQAFVIALAPAGAHVPPPPSVALLAPQLAPAS